MKKTFIILSFLMFWIGQVLAGDNGWQKAIDRVREGVVLIEYYEGIRTSEAIEEKGRVKKHLTGLLVDDQGLIMTTSEIFKASLEFSSLSPFFNSATVPSDIRVKFDGQEYGVAEFVGKDDDNKLAFIRMQKKSKTKAVQFVENPGLSIGNKILIVQHLPQAYDYELMVSERLISAVITKPQQMFLCENNINSLPGLGLVLDKQGEAVGIYQSSSKGAGSPFDFHEFPTNEPAEIIMSKSFNALIKNPPVFREKETTRKKWLGIYMQPFPAKMARYYGQEDLKGVLVNTVLKDSPAEKAGLMVGDVIISVNEQLVPAEKNNDLDPFRQLIRKQKKSQVNFRIFRSGQFIETEVNLEYTPIGQFLADEISNTDIGFNVKELTQDIIVAKQLDPDTDGVWVSKVERAGWADVAGLQVGDLILKVNEQAIGSLKEIELELTEIGNKKPEFVSLFVKRRTDTRFLFIKTNFE